MRQLFGKANARDLLIVLFNMFLLSISPDASAQHGNLKSTASHPVPDTGKVSLLQPVTIKDTGKNNPSQYLTLQQCIDYALQHQPGLNISLINIEVAKTTNAIDLSGALPQISANGNLIHYIQQSQAGTGVLTRELHLQGALTQGYNNHKSKFLPHLQFCAGCIGFSGYI